MSEITVIVQEEVWEFGEDISIEQITEALRHIGGRPKDRK